MSTHRSLKWVQKISQWIKDPFSLFREASPKRKASRKKSVKVAREKRSQKPRKRVKKLVKSSKKKPSAKKIKPAKIKLPKQALVRSQVLSKKPSKIKLESKPKVLGSSAGAEILVGKIEHYFQKAGACAFKVQGVELKEGVKVRIVGPATDFKMTLKSIQINRIPVPSGRIGEDVGIGVTKPVAVGDAIYLLR